MSLPWGSEPGIALLVPVTTVERAAGAAAAGAGLGASVLRTRYVAEVRRCADLTESILGGRAPAWAVRGLA